MNTILYFISSQFFRFKVIYNHIKLDQILMLLSIDPEAMLPFFRTIIDRIPP
jgi:hypothetical protein